MPDFCTAYFSQEKLSILSNYLQQAFFSSLELILQYHWGLCQEVIAPEPGAIAICKKIYIAKIVVRHFFSDHPGQVRNADRTGGLMLVFILKKVFKDYK